MGNNLSKNELVGYWIIESAPESSPEGAGEIYLRFTENGLLQWGYENQWRICVISYDYRIEKESIETVCLPNPRKEFTPYSTYKDGKLEIAYGNYETVWVKTNKQKFFESKNIWSPGILFERQEDYMSLLNSPPHALQIKRADYLGISPQLLINTNVLWKVWEYSKSAFASFHFEDFKYILEQGVLVDEESNMDDTLLIHLAEDGYTEAVKLMLDNGADVNHKTITRNTALDSAVFNNRVDTIKLLRERGALSGSKLKSD